VILTVTAKLIGVNDSHRIWRISLHVFSHGKESIGAYIFAGRKETHIIKAYKILKFVLQAVEP